MAAPGTWRRTDDGGAGRMLLFASLLAVGGRGQPILQLRRCDRGSAGLRTAAAQEPGPGRHDIDPSGRYVEADAGGTGAGQGVSGRRLGLRAEGPVDAESARASGRPGDPDDVA